MSLQNPGQYELTMKPQPVCEQVTVSPDPLTGGVPEQFRSAISIDAIHDGNFIPHIFADQIGANLSELTKIFERERDWGASLVAQYLAEALHLEDFFRVNSARALIDFGRFPGVSQLGATHMERMSINYPFAQILHHDEKRALLLEHYDEISKQLEARLTNIKLKIAIHTYDKRNPTATRRPEVSLITRPYGYQHLEANPIPAFDPLCPFSVVECTADRLLKARIALELEREGVHTADNFPYSLPEGSVEVRAQVWFFFRHLRSLFKQSTEHRHINVSRSAESLVWEMLLDTNRRSTQSASLRHFLHGFRTPPAEQAKLYFEARRYYSALSDFTLANKSILLDGFEFGQTRPSTLLIEVRKDLVWHFENGRPIGPNENEARRIARIIAAGIYQYLANDRCFELN